MNLGNDRRHRALLTGYCALIYVAWVPLPSIVIAEEIEVERCAETPCHAPSVDTLPQPPVTQEAKEGSFSQTMKAVGSTVLDDTKYLVTAPLRMDLQSGLIVAGVAGTIGTVMFFDGDIQKWVQEHRTPEGNDIFRQLSKVTNAIWPAAAGLAVGGYLFRSSEGGNKLLQTSLVSLEAQTLAGGLTQLTKIVVGRERPSVDPQGNSYRPGLFGSSFPSGGSTNAFAFAAVFSDQYPLPVQIVLYATALAVSAERVYNDHHFTGDVLAGAVIGYVIGKTLVWRHRHGDKGFSFLPLALPGGGGVSFEYRF
jgi:membrane-associated phospholipid phosphatase